MMMGRVLGPRQGHQTPGIIASSRNVPDMRFEGVALCRTSGMSKFTYLIGFYGNFQGMFGFDDPLKKQCSLK